LTFHMPNITGKYTGNTPLKAKKEHPRPEAPPPIRRGVLN